MVDPAQSNTLILGIESSCDETAAAVVRAGSEVLSSAVYSQVATHQKFGGVVPELASREHLRAILPVVRKALADAGKSYEQISAIAVTQGPGLAGALLVGISFAKALAFALGKPLIAVHHLEGHIHAVMLEERQQRGNEIELPALSLVVSGGHTHLYVVGKREDTYSYELIGRTRDDAAGEAFDKVAKLLGLGYPGGPRIDLLAKHGDPDAVKFGTVQIKGKLRAGHKRAPDGSDARSFDFSFSGIKTAVLRYVEQNGMRADGEERARKLSKIARPTEQDLLALCDSKTLDLIASFQSAVVWDLVRKTLDAADAHSIRSLIVTGGVAANSELREVFEEEAAQQGLPVYFPSLRLSTDNAAMIAAAAYPKFVAGDFAPMEFSAEASLPLR